MTWFSRCIEAAVSGSWRVVTKSSDEPEAWVEGVRSLGLFDLYGFVCSEFAGEAVAGGGLGC